MAELEPGGRSSVSVGASRPYVSQLRESPDFAARNVRHPKDVLTIGAALDVLITELDPSRRRIGLALPGPADEEAAPIAQAPQGFGTLGDLLRKKGKG